MEGNEWIIHSEESLCVAKVCLNIEIVDGLGLRLAYFFRAAAPFMNPT